MLRKTYFLDVVYDILALVSSITACQRIAIYQDIELCEVVILVHFVDLVEYDVFLS